MVLTINFIIKKHKFFKLACNFVVFKLLLQVTTELCLFHRLDCPTVVIRVGGIDIRSGPDMNILGITFDSKLQWSLQISNVIKKSISALHAINLIPLGGEAINNLGLVWVGTMIMTYRFVNAT